MGPKDAERRLLESAKRRKKKTGPPAQTFTSLEYIAVRALTSERKSIAQIANLCGLPLSTFKEVVKRDDKLVQAITLGRDDRIERIWQATAKMAFNTRSDKQLRALELLAKLEGMLDRRGHAAQTNVQINVNANTIPPAQDGRSYAALMKRITKNSAPTLIEHDATPERPVIVDPIIAVREKQRDAK